MEDEGRQGDHLSGVAATDGRWHHTAVTWRSSDGLTKLYDNGREAWSVVRGKGRRIPSGGTLVLGREQDCQGGCFDSDRGRCGAGHVGMSSGQGGEGQGRAGCIDRGAERSSGHLPPWQVQELWAMSLRNGGRSMAAKISSGSSTRCGCGRRRAASSRCAQ